MKLRKLKVSGWRCFAEGLELNGLGDGLNVVHGPNGVGKSSLFQALVRVLGDKHDGKSEAIKHLQSWGTELAPTALLEFEHAGQLWQVEKRFLHNPIAKMSRHNGDRFQPLAEGKQADERLREILQMETPRAGAVQGKDWGLAQMLWAEQGELQIRELSSPARQALQQSLGAQVTGVEATVVERRVQEEFERYFTSTGKLKGGASAPAIVGLKERLQQTQARLAELRRKLQNYDDAVRRIEDRRMAVEQGGREEREAAALEARLRLQAEAYSTVAHQRELAAKEVESTKAKAETIRARQEQIAGLRGELQVGKAKQLQWEQQSPLLHEDRALKEQLAADAHRKVEQIRSRRDSIQVAERRAKRAEAFLRAESKLRDERQLLSRIVELNQGKARLSEQRRQIVAPDAKAMQVLRKAFKDRDEARVRLEASLITLEFTAETAVLINVLAGDPSGKAQLTTGETHVAQGAPEVVVELSGIGTIRARGPAGSVTQLREALHTAESRLEQLLTGFGTADLTLLEQQSAAAAELQQQLTETQARIDTLLNRGTLEDIERGLLQAERQREEILAQEPTWQTSPPQPAALAAEAERLEHEFKSQIDQAEQQQDVTAADVNRAVVRVAQLEAELRSCVTQQSVLETKLAQLLADGLTDPQRDEAYQNAAIAWAAAQGALKGLDDKLAEFGVDPRREAQLLQKQVEALRRGAADAVSQLSYSEGELQKIIEESPYSFLAAAEEEEARLTEDIARQQRQLDAIKLLQDTLTAKRRGVVESLVQPIRQRATRTLQRIMGSRFTELEIAEDFSAAGVVPRDQTEGVGLPQLSGGEREQVYFAVRLALAEIAFPSGGELVVLDDVFTFTDRSRLTRIVQILGEAAERFQIVLLTCHPERYQGLPAAKFFDLEKIREGMPNA